MEEGEDLVTARAQTIKLPTGGRYDSSLSALTKRFIGLLESRKGEPIELNEAAAELSVQKRRIYDITNVLEGIGLIAKTGKSTIEWRGEGGARRLLASNCDSMEEEEEEPVIPFEELKAQIQDLSEEEAMIDRVMREVRGESIAMLGSGKLHVSGKDLLKATLFEGKVVVLAHGSSTLPTLSPKSCPPNEDGSPNYGFEFNCSQGKDGQGMRVCVMQPEAENGAPWGSVLTEVVSERKPESDHVELPEPQEDQSSKYGLTELFRSTNPL